MRIFMHYTKTDTRLIASQGTAQIWIEPWGDNSLRIRMTKAADMDSNDWALTEELPAGSPCITIEEVSLVEPWIPEAEKEARTKRVSVASIQNGLITARFNAEGWLTFYNEKGDVLLEEQWRNRDRLDRYCVPLRVDGREMKPYPSSDDYRIVQRFEANEDEKIFGLGQYQEGITNKKGATLELAHRNTQASVPFMLSSRGYGLLWNNPAIGTVTFATNKTEWIAEHSKKLDYFITAGDTPAQILVQYTAATGRVPMMPEYGMGFWQCKLRYRTQEELLTVARKHKSLGLPMDVIVVDFFHWTRQGDFKFERRDFPDPAGMIQELKSLGIELMASVWPTIDSKSENYGPMNEQGYLVYADRGMNIMMNWMGETVFFDATNPGARQYVWERCKENYYKDGIRIFWLDEAEPEYGPYDFDNYRYYLGPAMQCTNIYPALYAKAYYDGMRAEGQEAPMNLVRCGWAGSQRYGTLIWSGDIHSSFRSMREQLQAGLNMGIAGIPWWTTDIGGFLGGDVNNADFKELLIRWFAWGAFCPVFRLHGERVPHIEPEQAVIDGVVQMNSGSANEVWSYGEDALAIFSKYLFMRERLRPYIRECMKASHTTGEPVMRAMFFDFPMDPACWNVYDQYMFGPDILVAPILTAKTSERSVYLPSGTTWTESATGRVYEGGQTVKAIAPIDIIPLFVRAGKEYPLYEITLF